MTKAEHTFEKLGLKLSTVKKLVSAIKEDEIGLTHVNESSFFYPQKIDKYKAAIGLKKGDTMNALLHEYGHSQDTLPKLKRVGGDQKYMDLSNKVKVKAVLPNGDVVNKREFYKKIMLPERNANKNAINFLKKHEPGAVGAYKDEMKKSYATYRNNIATPKLIDAERGMSSDKKLKYYNALRQLNNHYKQPEDIISAENLVELQGTAERVFKKFIPGYKKKKRKLSYLNKTLLSKPMAAK